MSVKPIRDYDAKRMLQQHLWDERLEQRVVRVQFGNDFGAWIDERMDKEIDVEGLSGESWCDCGLPREASAILPQVPLCLSRDQPNSAR